MNRINPIFVVIFLVAALAIACFKLYNIKKDLFEAKKSYKESLELAVELGQLRRVYRQRLRLPHSIAPFVTQKKIKNGLAISSKNMDKTTLDSLMNKVLNGAYRITALSIKRVDSTKVNFYMEIKW